MRWRKLRRNIYTGLLYSLTLPLALSVPMAVVYADESQVVASPAVEENVNQTAAPQVVTTQDPPIKAKGTAKQEKTEKVPRRGSLAEWRAKKDAASSQASVSEGSLSDTTATTTPLAIVQPNGAVAESKAGVLANASSNSTTTTALSNALTSIAKSGNAEVIKNTTGGNATSGTAVASASVINNVNSIVANDNNKEAATFVSDIMGDTNGDIILQPMLLKAMLEAGAAQQNQASSTATTIENDIDLTAVSGDATVAANTNAGNATTGSAHAVADVINIVNSMVSANQSFVGTINIHGNLNGDILIAPDFIPQMIANNQQVQTATPASTTEVESNNTQEIINNVTLAAESGQALVNGNTTAGNATTGNADTNLVIFNLTGHEIVARDSLLVFVNVLGNWVGVIVDAPTGATAAAIGADVASSKAAAPNMIIEIDNSTQLINNVDLSSHSGNATVAKNTTAGNATTGNATASANILNMSSSQLNLTGWFGILFINVFGSWTGSFGIDTEAGTKVIIPPSSPSGAEKPEVIRFIPRKTTPAQAAKPIPSSPMPTVAVTVVNPESRQSPAKTVASVMPRGYQSAPQADVMSPEVLGQMVRRGGQINIALLLGSLVVIGASAYGIRRLLV